jgi:hypothetical protein
LATLCGCGGSPPADDANDASVDAARATTAEAAPEVTLRLAEHPGLTKPLRSARALELVAGAYRARGDAAQEAGWSTVSPAVEATLPTTAEGATRLAIVGEPGTYVEIRSDDLAPVKAKLSARALTFENAAREVDVVHVIASAKVEELRVLRSAAAPTTFRWKLDLGPSFKDARVVDGRVEALDYLRAPRIASEPIVATDAKGKVRALDVRLEGEGASRTITASLDTNGLAWPIVVDPAWTSTNNLGTGRYSHSATLLTNGKILVAGGKNASNAVLSSAEYWDPSTGAWSIAPSMPNVHAEHIALNLSGANVLVIGGTTNGSVALASTELWNGSTWTTYNMLSARAMHIAVYSPTSNRVLAAGGYQGSTNLASAEYFDGVSWKAAPSMSNPRSYTMAAYVATGNKALVVAGNSGSAVTPNYGNTEIYSFGTNTWSAGPVFDATATADAFAGTVVTLSSGKVLAFGFYPHTNISKTYDPATNAWTATGDYPGSNFSVASLLSNALVLTTDGTSPALFDPAANLWRRTGPHAAPSRAQAPIVAFGTGKALVSGGFNTTSTAEVFQQLANGSACGGDGDCASSLCVDGYCCNSTCTTGCMACDVAGSLGTCAAVPAGVPHGTRHCSGFQCAGASSCPTICSSDAQCIGTYFCSGGTCVPKKGIGNLCPTGAHECELGNPCVDGYCCESTCGTACEACDVPGYEGSCTGYAGTPHGSRTCNGYLCDSFPGGTYNVCPSTCASDSACTSTAYCSGTTCVSKKANGSTCPSGAHECLSGLCVDGYCCNAACGGSCQACDVGGSLGVCSNVAGSPHGSRTGCGEYLCQGTGSSCPTTCANDTGCKTGDWCSGTTCVAKKANGQTCPTGSHECTSGNCVDGVCCDTPCTGQCEACDIGGSSTGTCSPVSGAPRNGRTACSGSGACQAQCNGSLRTACGSFPGGSTVCSALSCSGSTESEISYCNGAGACTTPASKDCAPYVCGAGSCKTSCSSNADCKGGYNCSGTTCVSNGGAGASCTSVAQCSTAGCVDNTCCTTATCPAGLKCNANGLGTCSKPIATGCSGDAECGSGHCVDGVCCNSACTGQCEACDIGGSVGTCTAVSGDPRGARAACGGSGACKAQCNGSDRTKCGAYPSTSTVCVAASCGSGVGSSTRYCDGLGNCAAATTSSCSPYICGASACKTSCSADTDCVSGYYCSGSACVPKLAQGVACGGGDNQCQSGHCVDGVCCGSASCTSPLKCNANALGTCSKPLGATCSGNAECGSGNCVDGVCCNSACNGQCEACDIGGSVGTCTAVSGAPHGTRTACAGTGACQAQCNGSNRTSCGGYPGTSTVCAAASCNAGTSVASSTRYCDGVGSCAAATTTPCSPYVCGATQCKASCTGDGDCASGYWCSGTSCVAKKALGLTCAGAHECSGGNCVDGVCCATSTCPTGLVCNATTTGVCAKSGAASCTNNSECGSGHCVDGYCCDSACTGLCEACNVGGSLGICAPVVGAPVGTRGTCPGTGACQSQCNGSNRTACGTLPTSTTPCAAATCSGTTATATRYCDGLGSCAAGPPSSCSPYICGATACKSSCTADADCVTGDYCAGSSCVAKLTPGKVCAGDNQCASGNCVDGVCCTTATCGTGLKCNAKGDGTCAKPLGGACANASECGSGNCVDGVCCNTSCTGQCEACDVGGNVGTCTAVSGAPHGTSRAACGGTGACQAQCNGSDRTKCGAYPATSTLCAPASCNAGKASTPSYCDGLGSCAAPTPTDCAPFQCGTTTCKSTCSTTALDCAPGYACKTGVCVSTGVLGTLCTDDTQCKSGHCVDAGGGKSVCCSVASCDAGSFCADSTAGTAAGTCQKANGRTCSAASDCLSGFCVDGVCCESLCAGQCEACDAAGAEGKCSAINGAPHGGRTACFDGGADVCKALTCDGTNRTKCNDYAFGLEKECKAASCVDGTATEASSCDGKGTCKDGATKSCGNYTCGATSCNTKCSGDTDCSKGFACDTGSGKCVPPPQATCSADGASSISGDGKTTTPCAPYVCDASSGQCYSKCVTTDQCASGNACDGTACKPASGESTDSGGCAVDGGAGGDGAGRAGGAALALVTLGLVTAARRRRRAA